MQAAGSIKQSIISEVLIRCSSGSQKPSVKLVSVNFKPTYHHRAPSNFKLYPFLQGSFCYAACRRGDVLIRSSGLLKPRAETCFRQFQTHFLVSHLRLCCMQAAGNVLIRSLGSQKPRAKTCFRQFQTDFLVSHLHLCCMQAADNDFRSSDTFFSVTGPLPILNCIHFGKVLIVIPSPVASNLRL